MTPQKAATRIRNLLRKAAPKSGSSPAERESSALEAAKTFAEHEDDLEIRARGESPVEKRREAPPPQWPPKRPARDAWAEAKAPCDGFCTMCGGEVAKGERIWYRPGVAIHDWPCVVAVE